MNPELNYKTFGQGDPLIILHGMFGTLDNWQTIGKQLAASYTVYILDQRNHGRSPHYDHMDYPAMAADLHYFMESHWMFKAHIMGHSMGGKTAMQFALEYPDMVDKLVVVDIAPKAYAGGHAHILNALLAIDLSKIKERSEAETFLRQRLPEEPDSTILFLMKNLSRTSAGDFEWKMNFEAIHRHYADILAAVQGAQTFDSETLFVRGAKSNYILDTDWNDIRSRFPKATLHTIENAGHWVHADQPEALLQTLRQFLA
ncbi:MAG TPA: alpha/beta fold hydrolase [Saprospiraceae bacterium]|nr:alpha/beta fold hydrolase [Saprospiraceae bacterium]HMP23757.1 alpha/beta fold hydrolase [Saprospiraceae bacterium]